MNILKNDVSKFCIICGKSFEEGFCEHNIPNKDLIKFLKIIYNNDREDYDRF